MNPQIHAEARIAPPPPPSVQPVPVRFLELLGEGDFAALAELFTEDVWLRALLVREVHEETTAAGAAEAFRDWVGSPHGARLLEAEHHTVAGRERLRYRFLVRPTWAPDDWHVLEQTGFCRVKDGRISRFDLACTGYFPAGEELLEEAGEQ